MIPRPYTLLAPETAIERAARERTEHRAACDACIAGPDCPTENRMSLFPNLSGAIFGDGNNPDSAYRYALWRTPDPSNPRTMVVIGCNPSTATGEEDDPTIRRGCGFTVDCGYGRLVMLNMHAYRSTDVRELANVADPFGPENARYLLDECRKADIVVVAYGSRDKLPPHLRAQLSATLFPLVNDGIQLHAFRLTKGGDPWHPLYLPASCRPTPWTP